MAKDTVKDDKNSYANKQYDKKNLDLIEGYHSVAESIEAGVSIKEILLLTSSENKSRDYSDIEALARQRNIAVSRLTKDRFEKIALTNRHQGILAKAAAFNYTDIDDIIVNAGQNGSIFLVFLDGIEDPHNLGAILRTAHCMGANGVVIRENRSAGVTPTVARVSAGACYHIPVARVTNIANEIKRLKNQGLWFACLDMEESAIYKADLKGNIGLVIGAEGQGVSRLVKQHCDFSISIPMRGRVGSLNASVAFGMAAYELIRQRAV